MSNILLLLSFTSTFNIQLPFRSVYIYIFLLQSVAFTAAPFFVVAAAWFLLFALCLLIICLHHCCCRKEPYGYSRIAYALSLILLILFTIAAMYFSLHAKQTPIYVYRENCIIGPQCITSIVSWSPTFHYSWTTSPPQRKKSKSMLNRQVTLACVSSWN